MSQIQVPKGWVKKDLDKILVSLENGNRPKGGVKNISQGIPSLGGEHLKDDGGFNFENMKLVPEDFFKTLKKGIIKKSDLLMVKDGYTGRTCFVDENFPYPSASVSEHVLILRPKKEIIPKYLYYYLRSNFSQSLIQKKTRGIISGINTKFTKDFPIIFPEDLMVQKKIVEKLDYLTREINNKLKIILENHDNQIKLSKKQKEKLRQYALYSACFGKLTEEWRIKNRNVNYTTHLKKLHNPSLIEKSILEQIPKKWLIVNLGSTAEIRSGVTLGRTLQGDLISLPYLRVANVQDGYLNLDKIKEVQIKPEEKEKWLLEDKDILLTEGGDWDKLGRGTVWEEQIKNCIHQNHIFRVRLNQKEFNPHYVSYLIGSTYGKLYFQSSAKRTTNLATINSRQLKAFPIFCPSIQEQNEIVLKINEKINLLKDLDKKIQNYLTLIEKSKKFINHISLSILKSAFSGKLIN